MKLKIHVLTVSRYFPSKHPKKGKETRFINKILMALSLIENNNLCKIHTIRSNYELWEKRIKEVQEGKAILSLRYWSGKPYKSKQVEFACLDKDSGIGIGKLILPGENITGWLRNNDVALRGTNGGLMLSLIAQNDGLSLEDFKAWLKVYDISQPLAIIHFTSFRY